MTIKLSEFVQFSSVQEMNYHVNMHIKNNHLNDSEFKVLTFLSRYSCKYPGASYLLNKTIAESLEIAKRTVQRAIKRLIEKGIITKMTTIRRRSGGNGANIFVINEYCHTDCHTDCHTGVIVKSVETVKPKDKIEGKETINNLSLNTSIKQVNIASERLDQHNFKNGINKEAIINDNSVSNEVPNEFIIAMKPFFDNNTLYSLFKTLSDYIKTAIPFVITENDKLRYIIESCKKLVRALKRYHTGRGNEVRNIFAYAKSCLWHSYMDECKAESYYL